MILNNIIFAKKACVYVCSSDKSFRPKSSLPGYLPDNFAHDDGATEPWRRSGGCIEGAN